MPDQYLRYLQARQCTCFFGFFGCCCLAFAPFGAVPVPLADSAGAADSSGDSRSAGLPGGSSTEGAQQQLPLGHPPPGVPRCLTQMHRCQTLVQGRQLPAAPPSLSELPATPPLCSRKTLSIAPMQSSPEAKECGGPSFVLQPRG